MSSTREVVVLSGARTAIGGYGGSLKDVPPSDLAAVCVRESVSRAGIEPNEIGHVVFGNIIHTDAHDHYLARVAAIKGGLPVEAPALTLNRLCGSGLQAIITAAQAIMLGDADAAVAGGAENMSRAPYTAPAMRFGARMNDTTMIDMMVGALSDPFDDCHMGVTAENVAKKWNISREAQDKLAAESHRRAAAAIDHGYFKGQIVPVEIKVKGGTVPFEADETVPGTAPRRSWEGCAPCSTRPAPSPPGTPPASTTRRRRWS
jgi:acetyl-CoA C-acetyltransferase